MAELWETGSMISIEINYEPSIKGQLTNQPFNEVSYNNNNNNNSLFPPIRRVHNTKEHI